MDGFLYAHKSLLMLYAFYAFVRSSFQFLKYSYTDPEYTRSDSHRLGLDDDNFRLRPQLAIP